MRFEYLPLKVLRMEIKVEVEAEIEMIEIETTGNPLRSNFPRLHSRARLPLISSYLPRVANYFPRIFHSPLMLVKFPYDLSQTALSFLQTPQLAFSLLRTKRCSIFIDVSSH